MKKFAAWLKTTKNWITTIVAIIAGSLFLWGMVQTKADCHIKKIACNVTDSIVDSSLSPVVDVVCNQTMVQRKIEISLDEMTTNNQKEKIQRRWSNDSVDLEKYFKSMSIKRRKTK